MFGKGCSGIIELWGGMERARGQREGTEDTGEVNNQTVVESTGNSHSKTRESEDDKGYILFVGCL